MSNRECLHAYTAPFPGVPEYTNLYASDNGSTILSVRSQGGDSVSVVNLPPHELIAMGHAMIERGKALLMPA